MESAFTELHNSLRELEKKADVVHSSNYELAMTFAKESIEEIQGIIVARTETLSLFVDDLQNPVPAEVILELNKRQRAIFCAILGKPKEIVPFSLLEDLLDVSPGADRRQAVQMVISELRKLVPSVYGTIKGNYGKGVWWHPKLLKYPKEKTE